MELQKAGQTIQPGEVIGKRGPSKTTKQVKEAIALVAEGLGGVAGLIAWAKKSNDNGDGVLESHLAQVAPAATQHAIREDGGRHVSRP